MLNRDTLTELLNIPHYFISDVLKNTKTELHLELKKDNNAPAFCSECNRKFTTSYHNSYVRVVEALPISGKKVYLHVTKKIYQCSHCKRTVSEKTDWVFIRKTKRFAEQVYRLTSITTNQEAGWYLGLDDETVYRIDKRMLEEKAKEKLEPTPTSAHISVDEVSYRKYHKYLTNVIDTDRRVIIWNAKGRKFGILDRFYSDIGKTGCEKIESVSLDGARTYISSTKKYAVNALIVYDKFHIVQKLNKVVDAVRKEELSQARKDENIELINLTNCRQRFILLKRKSKRTAKQKAVLKQLIKINEPIYKAMLLKESFLSIYETNDITEAKKKLQNWIDESSTSGLESFEKLAKSFFDKMQYILNWFIEKISSAISEGFNNKIKRLKRMAYGYKDIDYFRLKIHQHCGLLNPRYHVKYE